MKLFCDGGKEKGREREGRKEERQAGKWRDGWTGREEGREGGMKEGMWKGRKEGEEGRKERQGNTVIIQGSCFCHKTGAVEIHIQIYHQEVTEPHCDYWRLLWPVKRKVKNTVSALVFSASVVTREPAPFSDGPTFPAACVSNRIFSCCTLLSSCCVQQMSGIEEL